MLNRAQFVTFLEARNRLVYLGASKFHRTQSEMLPVVNAVAAFELAGNGANLLQLIQAIGNLSAAEKIKYANALTQLYNSFPNPIYVTATPFTLHTGPANGIGVVKSNNVPSHQTDAVLALLQLNAFAQGQQLLQDICTEVVAGHRVAIKDVTGTASSGNECAALGMSDDYLTDLAVALNGNFNAVGTCIGQAMTNLGHAPAVPGGVSFTWLQNQINNTPVYQLQGAPSLIPSSVNYGANWIAAGTLQSWVNGTTVFPAGVALVAVDAAKVVIGTVLNAGANRNTGGHTKVSWSASILTSAGTPRPPYIGLGHELIHALHNMRGEQPGADNAGTTTVLYEYLCVGLGPFANFPNTENALRAGAGVALRPYYAP